MTSFQYFCHISVKISQNHKKLDSFKIYIERAVEKRPRWNFQVLVSRYINKTKVETILRDTLYKGKKLTFKRMSHDYKMKCPTCLQETRYIIQHFSKGRCKIIVNIHDLKKELNSFKELYTRNNKTSANVKIGQNKEKMMQVKEQQSKQKCQSMARQREDDADKVKKQQNSASVKARLKKKRKEGNQC